jgi:hypothetical protein
MLEKQKILIKNFSFYLKIGTIDKDHLNLTVKNLEENTAYAFKINNQSSSDEQVIQEFKFETASG